MADELTERGTGGTARTVTETAALIEDVAAGCRRFLSECGPVKLAPFMSSWPQTAARRAVLPTPLSAVRWLSMGPLDRDPSAADLLRSIQRAAPHFAWRQSYTEAEVGAGFLDCYAWTEIVGLEGPVASERIACGILLLGPGTHYPVHRHEAEEVYVPLCGDAQWQQGDGEWRHHAPGTVVLHASGEPHAMRTGSAPLVAVYVWRSSNLAQVSRLDQSCAEPAAARSATPVPGHEADASTAVGRRP